MIELPPPLRRSWERTATGERATDLLALAGPGDALDPGGVSDLLAYGYAAGRRSPVAGIRRRFEGWALAPPEPHPLELSAGDRADRLWGLLCAAVAEAVDGACAPRAALSGGLDSRAIAAALAEVAPRSGSLGRVGDPDCADLPVARGVGAALGLPHQVTLLPMDGALRHEERVWRATDGTGGPASAPGAPTDEAWGGGCDLLLSGCAGDVVWGGSVRPGPSPERRLRRLGVPWLAPSWDDEVPTAPGWLPPTGVAAWLNLWTRQAGGTWNGVLPRLASTPVVPVLWHEPLLSFCLALEPEDRRERRLVQRVLERRAPAVAPGRLPLAPRGPVHDLDRAFAGCPQWRQELERMAADEVGLHRVGLRPAGVRRLVRRALAARGPGRAGSISRVRALLPWGDLLAGQRP